MYRRTFINAAWLARIALALLLCPLPASAGKLTPYPPFGQNNKIYLQAIEQARPGVKSAKGVTGLIVPHHMLASDLIARGYHTAANGDYDRILLLAPDHFFKSSKPFATTKRSFQTVLGPVETDMAAVDSLLTSSSLFEASDLFTAEHGLRVHLPFIRHFFKDLPVIPIAVSIRSTKADWDRALPILSQLVTEKTLIIQSTDFSHYLPPHKAARRDQEVLNLIAAGDADEISRLHQPKHIDSIGAHYLHMKLQQTHFKATPTIIANRNSQHYFKRFVERTTSYLVANYRADKSRTPGQFTPPLEGEVFYFAGDTLLGRYFTPFLADEQITDKLVARILAQTGGHPLIVNLEGVLLDEIPDSLRLGAMTMSVELALPLMKRLNIVAVSLANNHTMDLGQTAYDEMKNHLEKAGFKVLAHGTVTDLGPFRITALSDLSNTQAVRTNRIGTRDVEQICRSKAKPPLFAFLHWGQEGHITPAKREQDLASALQRCAVSSLIGAHSHMASPKLGSIAGGQMQTLYSLGNFLFDQREQISSSALLEVRFFKQGTFASRLVPLPNLYDLTRKAH